jgi:hypothetical protein
MEELSSMIRMDMNSNNIIFVNPFNNQQINLSMLSQDVMTLSSRIDMQIHPPLPPDYLHLITAMQLKIDELEQSLEKVEMMVGEN